MSIVLVTGSSGLVGSACVEHFSAHGWTIFGLDGNQRRDFFGPDGDTSATRHRLEGRYQHCHGDIRDRSFVQGLVHAIRPDLVIHAAAQPSHDYAADYPFEDFETNAVGTLNLLESVRQHTPRSAFVFMSTNKVYGDEPNRAAWVENATRYDYVFGEHWSGFNESLSVDCCTHSLFGCSKLSADLYVQEYGRYFGLNTVCFRAGCLTGAAHAGAEQHGFLAYLVRCCREGRRYRIYGHKGKQVRDQLHAVDVARACEEYARSPRPGAVYNLGGGRANSVSVLEAIALVETALGKKLAWEYVDAPRKGDHICYISDTSKFRSDYPEWSVTRSLADIIEELACS